MSVVEEGEEEEEDGVEIPPALKASPLKTPTPPTVAPTPHTPAANRATSNPVRSAREALKALPVGWEGHREEVVARPGDAMLEVGERQRAGMIPRGVGVQPGGQEATTPVEERSGSVEAEGRKVRFQVGDGGVGATPPAPSLHPRARSRKAKAKEGGRGEVRVRVELLALKAK